MTDFKTADLLDDHEDKPLQVVQPGFYNFGGRPKFGGEIVTIKIHEDNSLVREFVALEGKGKVLVVDGGGSTRCALLGDMLAEKAAKNGWEGIIIYGLIRDSVDIGKMDIGVKALGTIPLKSVKRGFGVKGEPVHFHDVTFTQGHYVYSDEDGIIVSPVKLVG
ncbi:ribonuclease E activity regulator RraA [Thiofilum flexile]|uniref:ribonuclease E activity regulator RraA n=1 Tax=Thiofilum flexile TaxID=125627 RepID=UPI000362A369|nr:ribonuclease E activity regulator RraA [Thiofilum flexile]